MDITEKMNALVNSEIERSTLTPTESLTLEQVHEQGHREE